MRVFSTLLSLILSARNSFTNVLDEALIRAGEEAKLPVPVMRKLGELPFDFNRRSVSVSKWCWKLS